MRYKDMSAYRCRRFVRGLLPLSIWVALAFFPCNAFAQKDSTRIIKVKTPKQDVTILPDVKLLYIGMKQVFVINNSLGKINNIVMEGAKAKLTDSGWLIEPNKDGTFANMHIYGTNSKGQNVLLSNKKYIVRSIPQPIIKINDVVPDSVAEKMNLMAYGYVTANFPPDDIFKGTVMAFGMVTNNNKKFDTLYTKGHILSKEMKTAISRLKSGSLITFINIRYVLTPNNLVLTAPDTRIYMNATTPIRFGG